MSNDPIDNSAASEPASSDDAASNTNYSRWMTNMASEIERLKLYQLAIPGAHNSGVDQSGSFHVGNIFAACQYDSFPQQLSAGARYLDLRLVDSSYKKTIGNKFPTYKFIEVFEFQHGGISAGRRLEHLVGAVNSFATANPLEIIFIDFHHYDRGRNYSYDSLQRCLPKFNPIKNRLIPRSASTLSIGEIRQQYPGCNIVLCLAHDYPVPSGDEQDKWPNGTVRREQIWNSLQHEWNPDDASESGIISLVINSMKSPPGNHYWVLSAAVTYQAFPKDLATTSPVRTEVFKSGFQNANIVMVDFIDGSNSKASVTDRCINLNRQRALDRSSPPRPTSLVVTTKDGATIGGKFQNTLVFNWSQAHDNLGIRRYEIYRNGEKFATTSEIPYEHKSFHLKNYSFKVKAIDCVDNHSEFSNTFNLIQDAIPPTIPVNLELEQGRVGTSVTLSWDHSIDEAGVAGYEVYLDNVLLQYVPYKATTRAFTDISNLTNTKQYEITVRAKDINALYSEFATITLYPRPKVVNPRYSIAGYDEATEKYSVNIVWETDAYSAPEIKYEGQTKWYSGHAEYRDHYHPESGEGPTFNFQASQNERITHRCMTWYGRYPVSEFISFDFVFDSTPPAPINNLKVTSRTQSATSISWTPSISSNVNSYAISVNEEIPALVSKSVNTYTFEKMPLDNTFLIEVWAINNADACSTIETLTIEPDDNAPPAPRNFRVSNIAGQRITFAWSPPFADQGKVIDYDFRVVIAGIPVTVPVGLQEYITIDDRNPSTQLIVRLKCLLEGGRESSWIELIVPPRS